MYAKREDIFKMQNGRHMSKSRSGKDLFCRKIITIKVPKQRWSRKYNLLLDFTYLDFLFFALLILHFYICWLICNAVLAEANLNEYCFYWCSNSQMGKWYTILKRREFLCLKHIGRTELYIYLL